MEERWVAYPKTEFGVAHASYFGVCDCHSGSCVREYLKLHLHETISREAAGTT